VKYLIFLIFILGLESSASSVKEKYSVSVVPEKISAKEKKARFYYLVVPAIYKVYSELFAEYKEVKASLDANRTIPQLETLKSIYHVQTDKELLMALKPHPKSIVIAQAAIESAWGTSRFFREANNIFGIWSKSSKDKRIAASEKRGGTRTIWLRKFDNLEESVRVYYRMIGRVKTYRKFREYRYNTDDVFEMIKGLDKYSEMGDAYVETLAQVMKHNKLTKFDK